MKDDKQAISFLKKWAPQGNWVLTAIQTDRKAITTKTFGPENEGEMATWLNLYNGQRNIYFHVNPALKSLSKKAEREDIKEVAWLHVDIDPRAGENVAQEQERCLALLTTKLPVGVPAPTVVVFSGGGYQGFWKLQTPIKINGDIKLAEDAKRYNQQLELLFGADNCHNIDRIMRLPGSVNIPDSKKLKKGRVPALAEVIVFNENNVYPLTAFTPAASMQMAGDTGFSSSTSTTIAGNIERISDVSELDQWSVPERTKIIIVQGRHPDEVKQVDDSRSAWLFDCICSLVRCNVPERTIFAIISDQEFGISESVLDKGTNAEKYAIRQIERAKETLISPHFMQLNEKHAVVRNIGGKCRIIEEVYDPALNRTRLTRQSFEDFKNYYRNIEVLIGTTPKGMPITKKLGAFWIDHPQRRQYDTIVFAPGKDVEGCYNLWKGFACLSKPGDCSLFLKHIEDNICNGNKEHYQYLLSWMARAVQQPATTGEVAVVLRGGRGTGKGFLSKHFGYLFGRHFLQISNPIHLVGNFNSHLRDVVVLFADEAFFAGDKKHSSILKTLITEETVTVEAKGIDAEVASNFVHLIMASNDEHVVPAGGDERRFFVLDVSSAHQQDVSYFENIDKQMNAGGYEALLYHLMTLDISGFQVRHVPKTEGLRDQKLLSLSPVADWWYQRLWEGTSFRRGEEWSTSVLKDDLVDDYLEHTKRFNITRRGTLTSLGKELSRLHPSLRSEQKKTTWEEQSPDGWVKKKEGLRYFWILPELEAARKQWEKVYGVEQWPTPTLPTKNEPAF
jgi:Family of unknown function (DUF5906)